MHHLLEGECLGVRAGLGGEESEGEGVLHVGGEEGGDV